MFDALALRDPEVRLICDLLQKGLDQSGFADSGFACNKHELPLTPACFF